MHSIGMLTPSSNTVLEPVCSDIVRDLDDVSVHFSRFPVTAIGLGDAQLGQFADEALVGAAQLLAHAHVQAIVWNGTSGGWLGFDADERLCAEIEDYTGVPATTSVLALNEALHLRQASRVALVTPYTDDVQGRIVHRYERAGWRCVAERHAGLSENAAFADVPARTIARMVAEVAAARPDVIVTFCTNLRAAPLVAELEEAHAVPVYDTTAAAVWGGLRVAGLDPRRVRGWGSLFTLA